MRAEAASLGRTLARSPVATVARDLPDDVASALAAVPPADLPSIRIRGPVEGLAGEMACRIGASGMGPGALASWLAADVASLAGAFSAVAGTREVSVRLEGVDGYACKVFHVDAVRLRLVTTYVGPGTEYIPPEVAGADTPEPVRMATGHVAILRGTKFRPDGVDGLVHRSPPISGTGLHRLFLSVDEGI